MIVSIGKGYYLDSAEEMSAQVQQVTASAQSLAGIAQALQEVVKQLKLE